MAKYDNASHYSNTKIKGFYLDLYQARPVPREADDFVYTIESQYNHRPDLLAYDLYGNEKLWWVFVQRNMSILKDPIYDFETGVQIQIPKDSNLKKYLGV